MAEAAEAPASNSLYETDFHEWALQQARLLREKRFDDLDLENLVEEVEDVARSDKKEIERRLVVLMTHLLKWKYQPGRRSSSWQRTIRDQRSEIQQIVESSPSLRDFPREACLTRYLAARLEAAEETGIDFTLFPEECPFAVEEVLDPEFMPLQPDLIHQTPRGL